MVHLYHIGNRIPSNVNDNRFYCRHRQNIPSEIRKLFEELTCLLFSII